MTDRSIKIDFGTDYALEFKNKWEKNVNNTKQALESNGISIFTQKQIPQLETKHSKENKNTEIKKNKKFEKSFSKIKDSTHVLNKSYSNALTFNNTPSTLDDETKKTRQNAEFSEFFNNIEETDKGQDENDKTVDFMKQDFQKGFHSSGEITTLYEKDNEHNSISLSASSFNTYKSKNEKLSTAFGGSYEYEKERTADNSENIKKNVNAYIMAKYDSNKFIVAGGGSANIYDKDTQLYTINAGAMHKDSNIALTMKRQIVKTNNGIENETNLKLTLVNNDTDVNKEQNIEESNTIDNEAYNEIHQDLDKMKSILDKNINKNGLGVDLELNTSSSSDEYGVTVQYSRVLKKTTCKSDKKFSITPFAGVYDAHPNTDEAFKFSTGVLGEYTLKKSNGLNIDATLYAINNRTVQSGNRPINSFMISLDANAKKGKWNTNLNTGYINTNNNIKLSYISTEIERRTEKTSICFNSTITHSNMYGEANDDLQIGVKYSYNF
ncbi:hypothetical protein J6G99_07715 [bacterium]|nr:hypothetical protein [bacterium]